MNGNGDYLYADVVDDIRHGIATGRLAPGERLQSVRAMCGLYGVSQITVQRAIAELKREGLIRTAGPRGTFVSGTSNPVAPTPNALTCVAVVGGRIQEFGTGTFYGEVVDEIVREAHRLNLDTRIEQLSSLGHNPVGDTRLDVRPGDGLVLMNPRPTIPILSMALDRRIRAVTVDAVVPGAACVATDNLEGMAQLTGHLKALGHRRVAIAVGLRGETNPTNGNERRDGALAMARAHGLDVTLVESADYKDVHALLEMAQPPTAVMFVRDLPAIEFIRQARQRGIRVPEDISVTGFDDFVGAGDRDDLAELTTVRIDRKGLANSAVQILQEWAPRSVRWTRVPTTFVPRTTTSSPEEKQ